MEEPLALKVLLMNAPKSHRDSIMRAFEVGKEMARISHANATREALRELFRVADMDVENEPS